MFGLMAGGEACNSALIWFFPPDFNMSIRLGLKEKLLFCVSE